jgi:hypothetical protein
MWILRIPKGVPMPKQKSMSQFHVMVAAEAFAASLFAQAACDVSIQYGANQPEYDLLIARGDHFLKVSVKGSQDGGWGLCQNYKAGSSYHGAIDLWAEAQSPRIAYCFVQFEGVKLGEAPRAYLTTIGEIATQMKAARNGHGQTILYENYTYRSGVGFGCTDCLPAAWRFSATRVAELLELPERAHG